MSESRSWWREMTRYHWFVLFVAGLGWLFDTMDQQIFNLARRPAIRELVALDVQGQIQNAVVDDYARYATAIFLVGWGTGGIIFGILGDLIGRARTMLLTILLYSLFTGLSALSRGFADFALFRFLTGLGVGGEFAVGVSLVAEVMPECARPFALALLQALAAMGNIIAALVSMVLSRLTEAGVVGESQSWRLMFIVGAGPALLAILIRGRLQEPERWCGATGDYTWGKRLNAFWAELLSDSRWTKNAIVGLLLASSGIIGLWGIVFFSIDLQRDVFRARYQALGLNGQVLAGKVDFWASITSLTLNIGAAFGIYAFSQVSHRFGRKRTFALFFVLALLSTAFVFWRFSSIGDIFWMIPIMGFCQIAIFGGYAIYFPELFPTRLRSTGVSFCYNGARFVAAVGLQAPLLLRHYVFQGWPDPLRAAGVAMCAIFLLGLIVLPFAPETQGKPLPE